MSAIALNWITALAGVVTSIATVAYLYFTYKMFRELNKQNQLSFQARLTAILTVVDGSSLRNDSLDLRQVDDELNQKIRVWETHLSQTKIPVDNQSATQWLILSLRNRGKSEIVSVTLSIDILIQHNPHTEIDNKLEYRKELDIPCDIDTGTELQLACIPLYLAPQVTARIRPVSYEDGLGICQQFTSSIKELTTSNTALVPLTGGPTGETPEPEDS